MKQFILTSLLLAALAASTLEAQHSPTGTLTVAPASPVIKVLSNHFVNGAGQTIIPRGVNIRAADIGNTDNTFQQDGITPASLLTWHINIVRFHLDEDCWLGINGHGLYQVFINDIQIIHHFSYNTNGCGPNTSSVGMGTKAGGVITTNQDGNTVKEPWDYYIDDVILLAK